MKNMTTFLSGYIVSFFLIWRLALVILPFLPFLLIPGAYYNRAVSSLAVRMQNSYNVAGAIAEQAVSSVRTVYSFVAEEATVKAYSDALDPTLRLGMKQASPRGSLSALWAFRTPFGRSWRGMAVSKSFKGMLMARSSSSSAFFSSMAECQSFSLTLLA